MIKRLTVRITASNLWCSMEYNKYPYHISKNVEKYNINLNSKIDKSQIMKLLTSPEDHLRDKSGKKQYHSLVENVYGIDILAENCIKIRGINIFKHADTEYVFSEEGKALINLYTRDPKGIDWKIKLAEIILKYEIRTRLIFYYSRFLGYKIVFPEGSKMKFLQKEGEKIFIFERTKKAVIIKVRDLLLNEELIRFLPKAINSEIDKILKRELSISPYFPSENKESYRNYHNLIKLLNEIEKIKRAIKKEISFDKHLNNIKGIIEEIGYINDQDIQDPINLSKIDLDFDREFEFVFNALLNRYPYQILGPFIQSNIKDLGVDFNNETIINIRGGGGSTSKSLLDEPSALKNKNVINYTFKLFEDINLIYRKDDMHIINTEKALEYFDDDIIDDLFNPEYKVLLDENQKFFNVLCKAYKTIVKPNGFVEISKLMAIVCDELNILSERRLVFSRLFWENEKKYYNVVQTKQGLPIHGEGINPDPYMRLFKLSFLNKC